MKQDMPFHPFQVDPSWYETYWLEDAPAKSGGRSLWRLIAALGDLRIERLRAYWGRAMPARAHRLHLDEV